jgi:hypothetical protein
MKVTKTKLIVTGMVLTAAIGGGVAYAAWSVTGSGSGAAGAAVASTLTITQVTPAVGTLYPGGPAASVDFTVNNPNPFPVNLTGISYGTPTSANTTACPNNNVSIDSNAPTAINITVAANSSSPTEVAPSVLDMAHTAPNGCQGMSFSVPLTATGTQQ